MTHDRDVIRVTAPCDEPEYDSYQEAVESVRRSDRTRLAGEELGRFAGCQILRVNFSDELLQFECDNQSRISFYIENGIIKWSLCPEWSTHSPATLPDEPELLFERSARTHAWRRRTLCENMVGMTIIQIVPAHAWLYFDVTGRPRTQEFLLMRIKNVANGRDILFWDYC